MQPDSSNRPPSVHALAQSAKELWDEADASVPEAWFVESAREAIQDFRDSGAPATPEVVAERVRRRAEGSLLPCLNGTGILLHTGLGRAPLAQEAVKAIAAVAAGGNLEFDLGSGDRGDRQAHVRELLQRLTGAEDALVVNNCAGAVLLGIASVAAGKEVLLSRGQMVEIGGSYRMPEVIEASGGKLVEVGCTNKTHLRDYLARLSPHSGAIVRCHRSNFSLIGFVAEPSPKELAELAHQFGIPFLDDVGSGCLVDTAAYGLPKERTLREAVEDGADLIMASGDKLLGGPQAGILLGKRELIALAKAHPLARALRIDKLSLAALVATLQLYDRGQERQIPLWRQLSAPAESIRERIEKWVLELQRGSVKPCNSAIGGGSLPEAIIPSYAWVIGGDEAFRLATALRQRGLIPRVQEGQLWIDARTIEPECDPEVVRILRAARDGVK